MLKNLLLKFMTGCLLLTSMIAAAQQKEILLWPNGAPGSEGKTGVEKLRVVNEDHVISNIHRPSITPYIPLKEATGAAVIIAPGGGHRELWITQEGYNP